MTGRPWDRTTEMIGGSVACTPCVYASLRRSGSKGRLQCSGFLTMETRVHGDQKLIASGECQGCTVGGPCVEVRALIPFGAELAAIGCTPRGSCNNTLLRRVLSLAHQNRTIAIASDFHVDGAKSPEIPQNEGVLGSEIAARNRRSLATFHRTLKSQCIIVVSCLGNRTISGVRDGHRNRKSQKSLRFQCAKVLRRFSGLLSRRF